MNPQLQMIKIPFDVQPEIYASLVEKMKGAFFLDSSDLAHQGSRYSYFSYKPLKNHVGLKAFEELSPESSHWLNQPASHDFWSGGYLGVIPYPDADGHGSANTWFGFYEAVIVVDERKQETFAASLFLNKKELQKWVDDFTELALEIKLAPESDEEISSQWVNYPPFDEYQKCFERIQEYLCAGDIYQVNLTQAFQVKTRATSAKVYKQLRKNNPSPYAAFINLGNQYVLSASPELFFKIDGGIIQTKPIKGTKKRVSDEIRDQNLRQELVDSLKDRAELLMITDLERNDLGKICEIGSVKVEKLCELESFAAVHHLVSTISGRLKSDLQLPDVFEALFPGGSITGAPKKRAMEIIRELESHERCYYTGAIGFFGPGKAQFNLPIRTMVYGQGVVDFFAGGGIVIDSKAPLEYEEIWWKVEGLIRALNLKRE